MLECVHHVVVKDLFDLDPVAFDEYIVLNFGFKTDIACGNPVFILLAEHGDVCGYRLSANDKARVLLRSPDGLEYFTDEQGQLVDFIHDRIIVVFTFFRVRLIVIQFNLAGNNGQRSLQLVSNLGRNIPLRLIQVMLHGKSHLHHIFHVPYGCPVTDQTVRQCIDVVRALLHLFGRHFFQNARRIIFPAKSVKHKIEFFQRIHIVLQKQEKDDKGNQPRSHDHPQSSIPGKINVDSEKRKTKIQIHIIRRFTGTDFAVEHNVACCRKGDFFQHPFGSVPKVGAKKARSNIIYIANNPVERQLVEKAEEYRWTFLTYAESDHPFSEKLVRDKASQSLRRVLDEVDGLRNADRPLNYAMLKRFFKKLDRRESLQLTDYIISKYNVIDYDAALSFFDGNYRAMLTAIHSTTGSEYDLNEPFVGKSDAYYNQMTGIILRECGVKDIHAILSYDMDRKYELFLLLRRLTRAPSEQIGKYLHMPIKKL